MRNEDRIKTTTRPIALLAALIFLSTGQAAEYTMRLNADGTFTSPTTNSSFLNINEGDAVTFTGLSRTDGIVVTNPLTDGTRDPCTELLPRAYRTRGNMPDANEFTGPMRKGVSGIFSLGPMSKPDQTESFREIDMGLRVGTNACLAGYTRVSHVLDPADGHHYQLCRDNAISNETMSVTFENPDIDGVIIRMNWNDIETGHYPARDTGIFEWSQLDSQMDASVRNGKTFTLDFRSGIYGMPAHEYSDFRPVPGRVTPLFFHTVLGNDLNPPNCGSLKKLPSPADQSYKDAYEDFLTAVIRHVRGNTAWWQALAHIKLSGVNLNTSEAKTAHLCSANCLPIHCTTKIWAEAPGGIGWIPEKLYQYYREVGNTIYEESLHQKSIGFQLIQDGYPRAIAPDNYFVAGANDGNPADDDALPGFDEQTVGVLNRGQKGDFAARSGSSLDPVARIAGKAFVPQHSGLQTNPEDTYNNRSGLHECAYNQPIVDDPSSPNYLRAKFPLACASKWGELEKAGTGCPNKWNRREGYEGQITGWQTTNAKGVANANEVSSALFNATTNSNAVFVELYEERLWEIMHLRGTGPRAAPVTDDPEASYYPFRKNLHKWSEELHARRKYLADSDSTDNPFLEDPFPTSYRHVFSKDLALGEREVHRFISPYKCISGGSASMERVGVIEVNGLRSPGNGTGGG